MITPADLVAEGQITYRQLDYWVRKGYLAIEGATPGSGYQRVFTEEEAQILRAMSELVQMGLRPHIAAIWAPELAKHAAIHVGPLTITKEHHDRLVHPARRRPELQLA